MATICVNCDNHIIKIGVHTCRVEDGVNFVTGITKYKPEVRCSEKNTDGKCPDYKPLPSPQYR
jgi:hypothetical protein